VEVPFAAGRRPVPVGPAVLARLTGAPIVGAWIAFEPTTRRLVAGFERLRQADGGDVETATAAIGAWCARAAARFPDQWFVFSADWREHGAATTLK
jgi:lauroyl/myristoyl acyltransferase